MWSQVVIAEKEIVWKEPKCCKLVQMEMLLEIKIERAGKDHVKTKPNVASLNTLL